MNLSQSASRSEIEAAQVARIRQLLQAVLDGNAFYGRKLAALRGDVEISCLDDFRRLIPFTLKRELVDDQEANPPYGSNLTYPLERYTRIHFTNGTTGHPLRWLDTPESWEWMLGNWARVYRSAGVTAGDRIYFAFSFGPFLGFWTAFDAASRMGCLCIPGGGVHTSGRLRAILDLRATVLCCTPTYALRLAEVAAEEKIDLRDSQVRRIFVAGETGGSIPSTRARIEEAWPGAKVVDQYGMTEVGPVSYGCPARPGAMHVIESGYVAEIVDPVSGAMMEPGGRGELILTNLGRTGSPLLRYRTGDIVERGAPGVCACGSSDLVLEGGILTRTDDMVIIRGVNLYPSAIEDVLRAWPEIAEYRVTVGASKALSDIRIQVELKTPESPDGFVHHLENALQCAFTLRIPVSVAPCGSLPRFEMKARRWFRQESPDH
jgi:phenylacetate-CoA ligase